MNISHRTWRHVKINSLTLINKGSSMLLSHLLALGPLVRLQYWTRWKVKKKARAATSRSVSLLSSTNWCVNGSMIAIKLACSCHSSSPTLAHAKHPVFKKGHCLSKYLLSKSILQKSIFSLLWDRIIAIFWLSSSSEKDYPSGCILQAIFSRCFWLILNIASDCMSSNINWTYSWSYPPTW